MVNGLAIAETTPGPLIMVVQFVAFSAPSDTPATSTPGSARAWPRPSSRGSPSSPASCSCFSARPRSTTPQQPALSAALTGITAAVVGVIANLAIYFATHTLFTQSQVWELGPMHAQIPVLASVSIPALAITGIACLLIFLARWSVLRTLGACAILGILTQLMLS